MGQRSAAEDYRYDTIFSTNNIGRGRDGSKTVVCKKNPLWYVKKTS
jgi:hypothetical protein